MKLNQLRDNTGARKSRMCVGRGIGCSKGKTCGRGVKGQKARSGVALKGFEGGQMSLLRRMPKRGFKNFASHSYAVVNLDNIQEAIDSKKISTAKPIDAKLLVEAGVIRRVGDGLRLLAGRSDLKSKVTFIVTGVSSGAVKAVEKAGGKVDVLPAKVNKLLKGKLPKKERDRKSEAGK
ncbi:MAG: 50S ribosomal protein L15 [Alphaproteobacteria bacterium]|nr:50S ribosomal protein L15 [Alphaproteobacteria bacterium]MCK5518427.1 50S ribosomal protein L15 [Alphaproteobacteria bacterium]MCK5556499.1 50S ribosomal protein L15 [Alphaproteobacteria bacterium]MCK5658377.1 50S ribosomal protein L15 [Alphaproteobacteria bacterium]